MLHGRSGYGGKACFGNGLGWTGLDWIGFMIMTFWMR